VGQGRVMKPYSDAAWLLMLPAAFVMAFVAVLPLVAVFSYSFHDIFSLDKVFWVGTEWYQSIVTSPRFWASLGRSALFSALALAIQLPLGIAIALMLRRCGPRLASLMLMSVAIPLVVPTNMIAGLWLALLNDNGLIGRALTALTLTFDYKFTPLLTWVLILVVDTWHWLGLVVILAYAGLSSVQPAFYQAAAVDGASRLAVFRWIELPKISGALWIVLLLRSIDSFMIYTEVMTINAGGPNDATTFLSLELGEEIKAYSYGTAAARAMIDFLVVLTVVWVFVKARLFLTTSEDEAA
jgi:glycerol transport system permease protein